jgi:predicted membrane protein
MKWIIDNGIYIIFAGLVGFVIAYLFSAGFRQQITVMGIDAGLITGTVASFALLVSIKQSNDLKKQSAGKYLLKSRKFNQPLP